MKLIKKNSDSCEVQFTNHELIIINNAINEICNGPDSIEEWEFQTRVGISRQEAIKLMDELKKLGDS